MSKKYSKWIRIIIAGLACCVSTSSMAMLTKGGYVGAQIGTSKLSYSNTEIGLNSNESFSNSGNVAWYLYTGFQFNQNFAFHLGYVDFRANTANDILDTPGANVKVKSKAIEVMGKFVYPLSSVLAIYAKGGFDMVRLELNPTPAAQAAGFVGSGKTRVRPAYGVGAAYEFYPNLSGEISYSQIVKGNGIEGSSFLGIGLTYGFNY